MRSRHLLFAIAALCIGFLGFAVYMQHFKGVQACPLCVLQRYAFFALALFCFVGAFFNVLRIGVFSGLVAALSGAVIAGWQLWIGTQPGAGCGIDPLEKVVNSLITAKWLPFLFHAEGSCGDDKFRLFALSVPQWSLLWFAVFAMVLTWVLFRRGKR